MIIFLQNNSIQNLLREDNADHFESDYPIFYVNDNGKSAIDTALRETSEECGITNLEFTWGKQKIINVSHLTFFIAQTKDEPYITENPKTGILEHLFAEWVEWEELEASLIDYLIPAIRQAQKIIENV